MKEVEWKWKWLFIPERYALGLKQLVEKGRADGLLPTRTLTFTYVILTQISPTCI